MPLVAAHLWESTLCAALAAVVALLLRNAPARTRHVVWAAASLKFLLPFSLLVWLGEEVGTLLPELPAGAPRAMADLFESTLPGWSLTVSARSADVLGAFATSIALACWLAGSLAMAGWRGLQWRRFAVAVRTVRCLPGERERTTLMRTARRFGLRRPPELVCSAAVAVPAVAGWWNPRLLWPTGLSSRLTDSGLDAVIAHELCHLRRRDHLVIALHTVVEVLFWFHPAVWWISRRLTIERERACDQAVLADGANRVDYARALLDACRVAVQVPPALTAQAGAANLTARLEWIMQRKGRDQLSVPGRLLLTAAAAVAAGAPLAAGLARSPSRTAVSLGEAGCPATPPIAERPPDDPHAATVSGFAGTPGPWFANEDRTIWAWGGSVTPGTLRTKVLWVRPAGRGLTVVARPVAGDAPPARVQVPAGYPWTYQPSGIEFSAPGCWEIRGDAAGRTLRFIISVPDPTAATGIRRAASAASPAVAAQRGRAVRLSPGVQSPRLVHEVKPSYTKEAMHERIQGTVLLAALVLEDGTVGETTILQSLDPVFGLDDAAVDALSRWQFEPGIRDGIPVPVMVDIEMRFTLR